MDIAFHEEGDSALARQLTLYWKRGDGIMGAFLSAWGDRQELERRFQALARRLPEGVEAIRLYESYLTNFAFANGETA